MAESENRLSEAHIAVDLVARIGAGDLSAEQQMCERYYYRLFYFIRKRTGGNVELARDICQQAFLKGLEKLRSRDIKNPASLAAFLHGIAVHDVMSEARTTKRHATEPDLELINQAADDSPGPLDHIADAEVRSALHKYLERLTPRHRDVLIRLYLRDEDRESICASEGYNAKQFNTIVWRAKQDLKALLLERSLDEPDLASDMR